MLWCVQQHRPLRNRWSLWWSISFFCPNIHGTFRWWGICEKCSGRRRQGATLPPSRYLWWRKFQKCPGAQRSKMFQAGCHGKPYDILTDLKWLVVLTILKNIRMGRIIGLSHILWKKTMLETTNQLMYWNLGAKVHNGLGLNASQPLTPPS